MQSDVFEDFASDDGFGSDFGDDDDDGAISFSDEQIANVLDLMTEGSMARLNSVFCEDATESVNENRGVGEGTTNRLRPRVLAPNDGDAYGCQNEQRLAQDTRDTDAAPSVLSLLDELFPVVDLSTKRVQDPDQSSSVNEETNKRSDKQPEWMRALLDDMYAGSLVAPRLTSISEGAKEDSLDDSQSSEPSQHQVLSAESSPEKQPSWLSLLEELYPAPVESPQPKTGTSEESECSMTHDSPILQLTPVFMGQLKEELAESEGSSREISSELRVDTTEVPPARDLYGVSSISSSLDGNLRCSSLTWGKFSPDRMPVRHDAESLVLVKASKQQAKTSKRLCYVPLLRSQKRRVRSRIITPAESELTFRPKINNKYDLVSWLDLWPYGQLTVCHAAALSILFHTGVCDRDESHSAKRSRVEWTTTFSSGESGNASGKRSTTRKRRLTKTSRQGRQSL